VLDQKQFKNCALRYARELQIAIRTSSMLSVEHTVAARPVQQSFKSLSALLEQTGDFTLGFVNNRVMLNKILTTVSGLSQLENDFLRHGVGAVQFETGVTLRSYQQLVGLIATPLKSLDAQGGPKALLAKFDVPGLRIFPASANQIRTEGGDTVLEMDEEAFLLSQKEYQPRVPSSQAFSSLFEAACLEAPRTISGPDGIMRAITPTLEAALVDQRGNPQKAYVALAELLRGLSPDLAVAAFVGNRQRELRSKDAEEIAAEIIEDTTLSWAAKQLAAVPTGADAFVVEADVIKVLVRCLHVTQTAERLATKLAQVFKEYAIPQHKYAEVEEELKWVSLPPQEKHKVLLHISRFTRHEFRRLTQHIQELLSKADVANATEVATHYFDFLDVPANDIQPEELSRGIELINIMAGVRTRFVQSTAERLVEALQRETMQSFGHFQLINLLTTTSQIASNHDDYDVVQMTGTAIEQSLAQDQSGHAACCGTGLKQLLSPSAIERVVELYIQKRDDRAWARNVAMFLRWAGPAGVEVLFRRLEDEQHASNRMVLIRLIGRTGTSAVEVTRQRLFDERWYVVRNACVLLSELQDPELLDHLTPVLAHADGRVQEAATRAVIRSRDEKRGLVLAAALPHLCGSSLNEALEELLVMRVPETVPDLVAFVYGNCRAKPSMSEKALHALIAIEDTQATSAIQGIVADITLDLSFRKLALRLLSQHRPCESFLQELIHNAPGDPIVRDCRRALAAAR